MMQTLEAIQRRLQTAEDLHGVVKTMKALAAVSIRQYEEALSALINHARVVELGFQVMFQRDSTASIAAQTASRDRLGAVVFGSDQGMCGQLNEQIVTFTADAIKNAAADAPKLFVVGQRVAARLQDLGLPVEMGSAMPSSIDAVAFAVQEMVVVIERWVHNREVDHVAMFYTQHKSAVSFVPIRIDILPVDQQWLARLKDQRWPTKQLPAFTMTSDRLFSALIRHYLIYSLFRGFVESLASENASRLASMQGAERNIQDRLNELQNEFHQQRQMSITSELLDIVGGFEAITSQE